MNYSAALQYPFKQKSWFVNGLMMMVCMLIPVVGPLVLLGYQVVVTKTLIRDLNTAPPKFDFANFSKYLQRGVAPFVVALIASFVLMPVIFLCWLPFIATMVGTGGGRGADAAVVIGIGLSVFLEVVAILIFSILIIPLQLRAELEQKIGSAFQVSYLLTFIKRMWKRILMMTLVLMIAGVIGAFIGILLCFVGIYLVATLLMLVQAHLRAQLYLISLERNVPPVTIQPDELVTAGAGGFEPLVAK